MYASHTLISYPIVTRYGVSRHRCVSIAVGATAITDSLTLLVLAIVGSMYRTDSVGSWSWLELILKVSLMGLFIIYSFPRIGRWFYGNTKTVSCNSSSFWQWFSSLPV